MSSNGSKHSNLLIDNHPELLSEWDYEKNNAVHINVNTVTYGSKTKVWWKCNTCKGKYKMSINNRTSGQGCPYCAGKKVLKGYNDLQAKHPELVESEWDWDKNNKHGLKPDSITYGSKTKVWWKCNTCKGKYMMSINNKTNGQGCPFCAGQKVLKGFNDLQTKHPELVESEWDWDENNKKGLKPDEITSGSNRKAWWNCNKCSGKYEMSICNRIMKSRGCPYCTSNKVLKGYNDLQTKNPELVESEWDWDKNNRKGLKPDEITSGSNTKAWWKCSKCKHEWETVVKNRTVSKSGCPACAKRVSRQENEVAEYVNSYLSKHYADITYTMLRSLKFKRIYEMKKIDPDTVLSNDLQEHLLKELDIYIPELSLAIEYDGDYWHDDEVMLLRCGLTNEDAHRIKQLLCKHVGIELLFISEHDWLHDTENVRKNIKETIDIYDTISVIG